MRLWHQDMIPFLSAKHLLGQHRECCALRGLGWGKKHSTVDYVFTYPYEHLVAYHWLIMDEMEDRGYKPSEEWDDVRYRGKNLGLCQSISIKDWSPSELKEAKIYTEHDDNYLKECIENLKQKGYVYPSQDVMKLKERKVV